MRFCTWPGDDVVVRSLSADSRFPGFTSYSATICRKNSFAVAKGSVFGPLNDPRPAPNSERWETWSSLEI